MTGYIKLHRQIMEWEWYDDANTFRLFIHCLIEANHKDKEWRGIKINRGQFHTSIGILSAKLKLSDKAVRIALGKLTATKELAIKGASNGTMITICNYESYQGIENTEGQTEGQAKGDPKGKRRAITKNEKNDSRKKEDAIMSWETDFEIYKTELRTAYEAIIKNKEWIAERQGYHPNLDILLTLKKSCVDFWATDQGWKNKIKSKSKEINWTSTFNNALTQKINQVYKPRSNDNGQPKTETKRPVVTSNWD